MPRRTAAVLAAAVVALAACDSGTSGRPSTSTPAADPTPTTSAPSTPIVTHRATPTPNRTSRSASPTHRPSSTHPPAPARTSYPVAAGAPVIVVDPGHSVSVQATDPATGLNVSDYENEPEMRDVYAVAQLVRTQLQAAGYRVVMTKPTLDTPTSLAARARVANDAHAALALSIHDQAGSNGGIGFRAGNNTVYYQSVGDYRATPAGHKVYFTDSGVAALSRRYGQIFQQARAAAQGTSISLLGNTGYDLGSRGLAPGDIWIVQLLSKVPWIYNEAGGNSAGMVGLSSADEQRYATGLVNAVKACIPLH